MFDKPQCTCISATTTSAISLTHQFSSSACTSLILPGSSIPPEVSGTMAQKLKQCTENWSCHQLIWTLFRSTSSSELQTLTYCAIPPSLPVSPNFQTQSTGSLHVGVPDVWFLHVALAKQLGTSVTHFLRSLEAHLQG